MSNIKDILSGITGPNALTVTRLLYDFAKYIEEETVNKSGYYPDLRVGSTDKINIEIFPQNTRIHDLKGSQFWGRIFYAVGGNTILDKPDGVNSFCILVLRGANAITVHKLIATSYISGESISPNEYIEQYVGNSWTEWKKNVTPDGIYKSLIAGGLVGGNFAKMYNSISSISPSLTSTSTMDDVIKAMEPNSYLACYVGANFINITPKEVPSYGLLWGIKASEHRAIFHYSVNTSSEGSSDGETRYFIYDFNSVRINQPWEEIVINLYRHTVFLSLQRTTGDTTKVAYVRFNSISYKKQEFTIEYVKNLLKNECACSGTILMYGNVWFPTTYIKHINNDTFSIGYIDNTSGELKRELDYRTLRDNVTKI